jgi:predicted component of type VI protein secretion system
MQMPFVRIASGNERDTFVAVSRMVTTIGRAPECTIQLFDDTVSRMHCRIVFEDGAYWVEEAGPTNAVALDGKVLGRDRLAFGSRVILGETVLEFVKDKPDFAEPDDRGT